MQDLLVADPEEAWFVIRDAWAKKNLWASFSHVLISDVHSYKLPDILCHTYAPKFIATVTRMMVRITNEKTACAYEGTSK